MSKHLWNFKDRCISVVGSVGAAQALASLDVATAAAACDLVEIRLDLLGQDCGRERWAHLRELPLLMTARREDEGGAKGMNDAWRLERLAEALPDAALVDLEVASIGAAGDFLMRVREEGVPWVASFHNFERTPGFSELREKAAAAREAGAAVFKAAAMIQSPADLATLADFQREDHSIAISTMGMGPLAVVSRLLCAQCGSVLNYGYLGGPATAPGQWSAAELKDATGRIEPFTG